MDRIYPVCEYATLLSFVILNITLLKYSRKQPFGYTQLLYLITDFVSGGRIFVYRFSLVFMHYNTKPVMCFLLRFNLIVDYDDVYNKARTVHLLPARFLLVMFNAFIPYDTRTR